MGLLINHCQGAGQSNMAICGSTYCCVCVCVHGDILGDA